MFNPRTPPEFINANGQPLAGKNFVVSTQRYQMTVVEWGDPNGYPVIALHGWLDNAASFEAIGQQLASDSGIRLLAVDLPGHGLSEHHSLLAHYQMEDYVLDMAAFTQALGLDKFSVVGHSLGGAVTILWAAVAPIEKMLLLDSLGPLTYPHKNAPVQLRKAMRRALSQRATAMPVYKTEQEAVMARMQGIGLLTEPVSRVLVNRGLTKIEQGYTWRTDPRLLYPTLSPLTEEQVAAFIEAIECPVTLIWGETGFANERHADYRSRLVFFRNINEYPAPGGHHFHMDEGVGAAVDALKKMCSGCS